LDDGAIYIDEHGIIEAVLSTRAPAPTGYATATRVETGGVIYPGLIDLHNHPFYDMRSLWTPPRATPYFSRYQWQHDAQFQRDIGSSDAPLLAYWNYAAEETMKYVELKALVSGVTTLQGLNPLVLGREAPREGRLVRHVEQERRDGQPVAADFVFLPDVPDPYALFRQTMANGTRVIYHLAEGSDPELGREFEELYQHGCVGPRFVGIHANALTAEQLHRWASQGGTLVWSPLSNLWLYGQTTDVAAARAAGLRICLGPDWSISGSKNLLDELKVADLWNHHQLSGLFSDQELCEMVTSNPADALGLGDRIGRISDSLRADLVVMTQRQADPYRNLIESTERDVQLVVVGGRVCYGTPEIVQTARTVNVEALRVGSATRAVSMPDPTTASAVRDWSDIVTALERVRAAERLLGMITPGPHGQLPPLDTFAPDESYFRTIETASIPGSILGGLREYYPPFASAGLAPERASACCSQQRASNAKPHVRAADARA
jgi:cytosine/adenosine deaminase-related metal-dependent hydrolase